MILFRYIFVLEIVFETLTNNNDIEFYHDRFGLNDTFCQYLGMKKIQIYNKPYHSVTFNICKELSLND
jgi:hypothetical protein